MKLTKHTREIRSTFQRMLLEERYSHVNLLSTKSLFCAFAMENDVSAIPSTYIPISSSFCIRPIRITYGERFILQVDITREKRN